MKQWQEEAYWGRHTQLVPAQFARGYQYITYPDRNQVIRAIPADGYVQDQTALRNNVPTPQIRIWFPEKRKGRWRR